MNPKRSILIFWALLLGPSLVLASAAYVLLSHEQERLNRSGIRALEARMAAVSDVMHLTVDTLESELSRSLLEMDARTLLPGLLAWEKQNPLVRHIFVHDPENGLVYPEEGLAATRGEQRFKARYDALFSGRLPFDAVHSVPMDVPAGDSEGRDVPEAPAPGASVPGAPAPQVQSVSPPEYAPRKTLFSMARVRQEAAAAPDGGARSGWIPWFSENSLCILGWARQHTEGPVYGMELELMAVLSQLVVDFPPVRDAGLAIQLRDGSGNVLHQTGELTVSPDMVPVARKTVSPLLPHWQLAAFSGGAGGGTDFFYLSLTVLGMLLVAILTGGVLITRYTQDQIRDVRQKTSFVSAVSHELKTPLTSIRMYAELLQSGRVTRPEKRRHYLDVMVSESQRLTRLINNVLDFSRLEQGRKRYHERGIDLKAFVNEFIREQQVRIEAAGVAIHARLPDTACPATSDPDALSQVLLNLTDNVLKYAAAGGFIGFDLERKTDGYRLRVRDHGPGIPTENRTAVFEKFFRGDTSLTADQPGSGLGLAIARQLLRDLGGDLTLVPDRSGGCCFIVRIP